MDALVARILADPDDLAARMVYGDALASAGDPRGELITSQCALASAGILSANHLELSFEDLVEANVDATELARLVGIQRRVDQLSRRHREAWLAPLELPTGVSAYFRRGMPEVIVSVGMTAEPQQVAPVVERLATQTPIAELHLKYRSNVTGLEGILRLLAHLDTLALETVDATWPLVEQLIAAAPRLRRLELVQLDLDAESIERLAALPVMRQLRRLSLHGNRSVVKPIIGLLAAHPHLVVDVSRCGFTDADIAALTRHAPRLQGIDATGNSLGIASLRKLVALPELRHLGFDSTELAQIGDVIARGKAPLRSLKLGRIHWKGLKAIAAAPHLAGLRELDLASARAKEILKTGNVAIAAMRNLVRLKLPWEAMHDDVELSRLPLLVSFHKTGLAPAKKPRR